MKLSPGVWRHRNCQDMDMLVLERVSTAIFSIKLRVMYLNRKGRLLHRESQIVKVNRVDFPKWTKVTT